MSTAFQLDRFDPETFVVPDEVALPDVTRTFRQAQDAIDHLRRERGEARAEAARFEQRAQAADEARRLAWRRTYSLETQLSEAKGERDALRRVLTDAKAHAERLVAEEIQHLRDQLASAKRERSEFRDLARDLMENEAVARDCEECNGRGFIGPSHDEGDTCEGCLDGRVAR